MKNSNLHCVPAILKTAALAAILAVPATPAFAQEYADFLETSNYAQDYSTGGEWAQPFEESAEYGDYAQWHFSYEFDFVYASAKKDFLFRDSVDLWGVSAQCLANKKFSQELSGDFFLLGNISVGTGDYLVSAESDESGHTTRAEKWDYTVVFLEVSIGANVRWHFSENFSVYAGARAGIGAMQCIFEDDDYMKSDPGYGTVYGLGVGLQWSFLENHALTLNYAFVSTTASPDMKHGSVGDQSYDTFSVGYKYTF